MIDPVKELLQIDIHHDLPAGLDVRLRGQHRVVRTPSRPKAVAVFTEARINHRLQYLQQCLLDQSVRYRRDAQLALPTSRLRNHDPSYRTGPVCPLQQCFADSRPFGLELPGCLVDVQTIHTGRSPIGLHPPPCPLHVGSFQNCIEQPCSCVFGVMSRAAGFITTCAPRGFTPTHCMSPHSCRLLMHGL